MDYRNRRKMIEDPHIYAINKKQENRKRMDELSGQLLSFYKDSDKKARKEQQLCKMHHYVDNSRIGGSAITPTNCCHCDKDMVFGNTCTDLYCHECAEKLNVCRFCGARMD